MKSYTCIVTQQHITEPNSHPDLYRSIQNYREIQSQSCQTDFIIVIFNIIINIIVIFNNDCQAVYWCRHCPLPVLCTVQCCYHPTYNSHPRHHIIIHKGLLGCVQLSHQHIFIEVLRYWSNIPKYQGFVWLHKF